MNGLVRIVVACCALAVNSLAAADTFWIGVNTHLGQNRGSPDATVGQMRQDGVNSFRDEVPRSQIRMVGGQMQMADTLQKISKTIDLAKAAGIEPLISLGYGRAFDDEGRAAFAQYAAFVATTFKGRIKFYEVYNEWNNATNNEKDALSRNPSLTRPEPYAALLKAVYPAIKQADPSAIVLGGSHAGSGAPTWIAGLLKQGAADYMDGLSVHPYVFSRSWVGGDTPEAMLDWIEQVIKLSNELSPGKQVMIYLTELGWPTFEMPTKAFTEDIVAAYLERSYLLMRANYRVRGIWWYSMYDDACEKRNVHMNFGLYQCDTRTPKRALEGMHDITALFRDVTGGQVVVRGKQAWAVQLDGATGSRFALWSPDNSPRTVTVKLQSSGSGAATLRKMGTGQSSGQRVQVGSGTSTVDIDIDGTPTLFAADASGIKMLDVQAK